MQEADFHNLYNNNQEYEREDFGHIKNSVHRKQKERKLRKKTKKS